MSPTLGGYLRAQGLADPEAATNETFHRAFSGIDRFRGSPRGFRSWLFTIAHNIVIDERRRAGRRPRSFATDDQRRLDTVGGDTESDALDAIGLEKAVALLETLTTAQRDVIYLRVIAGLSVKETAKVMGRPPGAVKALQHRGLRALQSRLSADPVTETGSPTFPGVR